MFDANNARQLVSDYFVKGESQSTEWFNRTLESILMTIHTQAKNGLGRVEIEMDLNKEKYKLAKKKMLLDALTKLKFKVGVQNLTKKDSVSTKTYAVYTIVWGTRDV